MGDVGDVDAPAAAVAHRLFHGGAGIADDDAEILDARFRDGFDAVLDDRLIGHGDQLLGHGVGDGAEARAGATGKDQGFHRSSPSAGP